MSETAISVGQLTRRIQSVLEDEFQRGVFVEGEISNFKLHSSGHRYFTLKDDEAAIAAVMWKTRPLDFLPADGMRVQVFGRLTVYAPRGNYQIDVIKMRPAGLGDLQRILEERKRDLAAKGYFDWQRKKPLPPLPTRIGVVTSATGAALQDILRTVSSRFPAATIVLRAASVQGQGAAADVAQGINDLQSANVQVIIVGRGGGSIEDLWAFNEMPVIEAIYRSGIPVISAVGHETDETLSDLVADVRAATPTHAAVLVTPYAVDDLLRGIESTCERMETTLRLTIDGFRDMAESFLDGRAARRLDERVKMRVQRVDDVQTRGERAITTTLHRLRDRIEHRMTVLRTLHPYRPLEQGYAVLESAGKIVAVDRQLNVGESVTIRRRADVTTATITSKHND